MRYWAIFDGDELTQDDDEQALIFRSKFCADNEAMDLEKVVEVTIKEKE